MWSPRTIAPGAETVTLSLAHVHMSASPGAPAEPTGRSMRISAPCDATNA